MKKILASIVFVFLLQASLFAQSVQPAKILEKPRGILKGDYGNVDVQGTVMVRVQFLPSGEVGEVALVRGLPFGLPESAIEAAKKIKFEPAKKDGAPIASVKVIEYAFGWSIGGGDFVFAKDEKSSQIRDEKAEAVIQKAIQRLGGERYLSVKTVVGRGNFTLVKDDISGLPSAFVDYIVFPDKERTEFKVAGGKMIQTNIGETGWIADSASRSIKDQTPEQVADFKRGIRTSLDYFLRGEWRKEKDVKLEYAGRREASLGKRNEVVRLTYADGTAIEYEFAAQDGTPAKMSYKRKNADGAEVKEEHRFAQFVEVNGVFAPYIIDHYRDSKQSSRINYESIQYNTAVPETLFAKPTDIKKVK